MLDAGRELDALIALQVFRYTLDYEFADTLGAPCVRELRDQYDEWGMLPHYSTDIADAWLVVEKMESCGWWCQMRTPFEGENSDGYWAGFTPHSTTGWNGRPDHWTHADDMALAICRAALAACGVPLDDPGTPVLS